MLNPFRTGGAARGIHAGKWKGIGRGCQIDKNRTLNLTVGRLVVKENLVLAQQRNAIKETKWQPLDFNSITWQPLVKEGSEFKARGRSAFGTKYWHWVCGSVALFWARFTHSNCPYIRPQLNCLNAFTFWPAARLGWAMHLSGFSFSNLEDKWDKILLADYKTRLSVPNNRPTMLPISSR